MQPPQLPEDCPSSLQLWHRLLRLSLLLRAGIRPLFARWDLTGPQWGVFRVLGEAGPEGLRASELGDRLLVTHGNVTGLVDRLEEAGYAERCPLAEDRRVTIVRLTAKGREMYSEVQPAFEARVEELVGGLEEEESQQLAGLLDRLWEQVQAVQSQEGAWPEPPGCGGRRGPKE
jgi:DNA-binding MarR family transcriptional regulator